MPLSFNILLNFINIKYYDLNNDVYSEKYNNLLYLIYYIKVSMFFRGV